MISCSCVEYFAIYDIGLILDYPYTRETNVKKNDFYILTKSANVLCKTDLKKIPSRYGSVVNPQEGSRVNLTFFGLSDNNLKSIESVSLF